MRIPLEEAIRLIKESILPLDPETRTLPDALGHILAQGLVSPMDQPPFPRSPYDGYAIRSADSRGASRENPVSLKVIGRSFAGAPAFASLKSGEAVRIMTGGAIPEGADCVIAQEYTNEGENTVEIYGSLSPFENHCHQGEDFRKGDTLAEEGVRVTAAVAAVSAGAGCAELKVYPRPRVSVISTGDELQAAGKPLTYGQIYNTNDVYLASRLSELAVSPVDIGNIRDDMTEIKQAFLRALDVSELLICSGGVSVGQKDFVPAALEALGARIIFHGVSIKPGMPATFALLDKKPVLALSGNPFACSVSFELLARAAISRLASDPSLEPRVVTAKLKDGYGRKRPVRRFMKGVLENDLAGLMGDQKNGQMKTMIGANCLVELPQGEEPLPEGSLVNVYMLG